MASVRRLAVIVAFALLAIGVVPADARCRCAGRSERAGCCAGGPPCSGAACAPGHAGAADDDRVLFHFLLDARERIRREVTELPDGVETVTESDDPDVAGKIETHVRAMYARMKEGRPIHMRDPLFAALFRHADAIAMSIESTPHGVRVRETSSDPWVAEVIRAHAEVVSRFLTHGHAEMRRDHEVPPR